MRKTRATKAEKRPAPMTADELWSRMLFSCARSLRRQARDITKSDEDAAKALAIALGMMVGEVTCLSCREHATRIIIGIVRSQAMTAPIEYDCADRCQGHEGATQ